MCTGVECPNEADQAPRAPRMMLFDTQLGGTGVSHSLYSQVQSTFVAILGIYAVYYRRGFQILNLIRICRDRIAECPCVEGCMFCVCSARCSEKNAVSCSDSLVLSLEFTC